MPKISKNGRPNAASRSSRALAAASPENGYEGATVASSRARSVSRAARSSTTSPRRRTSSSSSRPRQRTHVRRLDQRGARRRCARGRWTSIPAWLSVYLELFRRVRNDADFRMRIEERQQGRSLRANRARIEEAQRAGEFRDDLTPKEIGTFVNLVLNGLALQRASRRGAAAHGAREFSLLRDAIGGARRDTPSHTPV